MSAWGNLCRVCASPADYDIFNKIPVYLHENSKDMLHWQTPIYELIQDITGLRIFRDDGLPQHICALCISYLKHAFTFREKAIEMRLNFMAVKEYKDIVKGKAKWNIEDEINKILGPRPAYNDELTEENAISLSGRPMQFNNTAEEDKTTNCFYKDQNKVNKRLITTTTDNSNMARILTNQTKSCLVYLCELYENPDMYDNITGKGTVGFGGQGTSANRARHKKHNLMKSASFDTAGGSSGCGRKKQNYEDDYPRNGSSDEYDEPESNGDSGNGDPSNHKNTNIFSYKEKIFEEDDIMDLDELKDLISMNIESTCKEHKCKYCSRRFMFEETIQEHLKTCIDYKFTEFFEEIKNLMYIKRCKEISPHEFIRRMIFSIRKTCEWLKENLIDTTLPDLLPSREVTTGAGESTDANPKQIDNNKIDKAEANNAQTNVFRANPINASNNILHVVANATNKNTNQRVNKTVFGSTFLQDDASILTSGKTAATAATTVRQTPINISNNILHEIERSEMKLKKPIARLATTTTLSNVLTAKSPIENPERIAFLEKLQNAAKTQTPPPTHMMMGSSSSPVIDSLPLIAVRQDLLETTTTTTTTTRTRRAHVSPLLELLQNTRKTPNPMNSGNSGALINPCARCPTCNLLFETLDALEIHNALQHNTKADNVPTAAVTDDNDLDNEAEHRRIIALFENEDEF